MLLHSHPVKVGYWQHHIVNALLSPNMFKPRRPEPVKIHVVPHDVARWTDLAWAAARNHGGRMWRMDENAIFSNYFSGNVSYLVKHARLQKQRCSSFFLFSCKVCSTVPPTSPVSSWEYANCKSLRSARLFRGFLFQFLFLPGRTNLKATCRMQSSNSMQK